MRNLLIRVENRQSIIFTIQRRFYRPFKRSNGVILINPLRDSSLLSPSTSFLSRLPLKSHLYINLNVHGLGLTLTAKCAIDNLSRYRSSLMGFEVDNMELKEFDAIFPDIVDGITENYCDSDVQKAISWLKQVVEYNVPFGKKTRGIFVVKAYKQLKGSESISDEEMRLAQVLGWCVEMLQAVLLVADDVMDQSVTRRGQPCWYKRNGVGLAAINDAFSLEACLYVLLKKYFSSKSYYINIVEIFHEVTFQTTLGQSLDLMTSNGDSKAKMNEFTPEIYRTIVKYKTAFYSFYLPIALAFYMLGITDQAIHQRAKEVLLEMGHLFQVQDDFIDCFGDPEITGKIGTDIEEGKCTWLIVMALQRANDAQRAIIENNYHKNDATCVENIKSLYKELHLPTLYHEYEEERYKHIHKLITQLEGDLPTSIFYELAEAIYKRKR